jgi:DNA mismatch repair protein MutL
MSRIELLDEATVNRIAAGEVVERPASAVKELVENGLDAGARRIVVEIVRGGKASLKVVDDGEGMTRDDALRALERHATSKIRSGDALDAIRTLGFRGEALPAIAAVSRMTLATRARDAAAGTTVEVAGGTIASVEPSGGPEGTSVAVRDLYFNTPARRKFLKGDGPEAAAVTDVVANALLARPDVSFKLESGGEPVLFSPGGASRVDIVRQVFGIPASGQLFAPEPVELAGWPCTVEGVLSRPQTVMPSRRAIRFFVNGRPFRSPSLARAVLAGYKNMMPVGRAPLALLFLAVDPGWVDVNVHPAKIEVRFREAHALEEALTDLIRSLLAGRRAPRDLIGARERSERSEPPRDPHASEASAHPPPPGGSPGPLAPAPDAGRRPPAGLADAPEVAVVDGRRPEPFLRPPRSGAGDPCGAATATVPSPSVSVAGYPAPGELASVQGRLPGLALAEGEALDWQAMEIIGQAFSTYILGAVGRMLYVVDQHVAHERVLFERTLDHLAWENLPVQRLLFPITMEVPAGSRELIRERLALLARYGFAAEMYSGGTLVVSTMPMLSERVRPEALLADLVAELERLTPRLSADQAQRSIAATIACRSAVMAGDPLDMATMRTLVGDLARARHPMTCPHGRPSVLSLSAQDIDRRFLRCS